MWIWNSASNLQTINNMPLGIWLSPYQPGYLESFSEQVLPKTHFYIKREINNSRELVKDKEAWLAAMGSQRVGFNLSIEQLTESNSMVKVFV